MKLHGKKVLVVGLGKSGVASTLFLYQQGAQVAATDINPPEKLVEAVSTLRGLPIRMTLGQHPDWLFREADLIVLSPGVPLTLPGIVKAKEMGIPIIGEVELASSFLKDKIIAITGSNGKSTTTALTAHLLRKAGLSAEACGNIGTPLINCIPLTSPERCLAVELSSFQLETIDQFRPAVATVLNVTPDHMDRYTSFEAYKEAKYRIFKNMDETGVAVINADEKHAEEIKALVAGDPVYFSMTPHEEPGVYLDGDTIIWRKDGTTERLLPAAELSLPGPHNLMNAMAAAAMVISAGADPHAIVEGLRDFQPLEHRLQPVGEVNGVLFINDSKATNIDSTLVALQSFERPIIPILGGKDKDGDFTLLNPLLKQHARFVILIGAAAAKIDASLDASIARTRCKTMEAAVEKAFRSAQKGDVVLLAPGCASFDMFDNFEHRGRVFSRAVRGLIDAQL